MFELGGVDVILGVAWLETLGEVKINWKSLSMSYKQDEHLVRLQGDPSLTKVVISPKSLLKINQIEAVSVLWEANLEQVPTNSNQTDLTDNQQLQLRSVWMTSRQYFLNQGAYHQGGKWIIRSLSRQELTLSMSDPIDTHTCRRTILKNKWLTC